MPSPQSLHTVAITAKRLINRLSNTPKPITIISRAQIDSINPSTIFDVLDTVPGLSIARSGGLEGQISLRGLNSNYYHSPLFIDGDRFKGRNTLEYLLIEPEDIAAVEVVRGPAAEAYGSEAVGGVVELTTYHAIPGGGGFHVTGGNVSAGFATVNDAVQSHGDLEASGHGLGFRLSLSGREAGNYQTPDGTARNSDYKTGGIGLDAAYAIDSLDTLDLTLRGEFVSAGRAGGLGGAPGYPYVQQRDRLQDQMVRLAYSGGGARGPFRQVSADLFFDNFYGEIPSIQRTTPGLVKDNISWVVGPSVVGGNALGSIPWGYGHTALGVDFFQEMRPAGSQSYSDTEHLNAAGQVTSIAVTPRHQTTPGDSQLNVGVFADNVWSPDEAWTATLSARLDGFHTTTGTSPVLAPALEPLYAADRDANNFAETVSLGVIRHVSPILDLVADAGTLFRMPSDTELFSASVSGTGYSLPNPALKPEHGDAVEGGFRVHSARASISATAYYDRFRDFVETVPVTYLSTSSTQPQNVESAALEGAEAAWNILLSRRVGFFGTLTYTRAANLLTGVPLPYVAPLNGRGGLRYTPASGNYSIHGTIEWAVAKTRIDPTQEYPTDGYAVLGLGAVLRLDRLIDQGLGDTRLIVTADNLLNTAYRSGATYANIAYPVSLTNPLLEPGRDFAMTLRHRF
ncbi:MAG TPA: TonB-dependent receptor [Steroidobacteraceae bacterium]|jgi:hemoglobin/transferrin/lactoferrin receptor protein